MITARDIMRPGAECVGGGENLRSTARRMRDLRVGALPVCGQDGRLAGVVTERDIVVKCMAVGGDPAVLTAGEVAGGRAVTVHSSADVAEVLNTMEEHQIRLLLVVEDQRLLGMITDADLARNLSGEQVGQFVDVICA